MGCLSSKRPPDPEKVYPESAGPHPSKASSPSKRGSKGSSSSPEPSKEKRNTKRSSEKVSPASQDEGDDPRPPASSKKASGRRIFSKERGVNVRRRSRELSLSLGETGAELLVQQLSPDRGRRPSAVTSCSSSVEESSPQEQGESSSKEDISKTSKEGSKELPREGSFGPESRLKLLTTAPTPGEVRGMVLSGGSTTSCSAVAVVKDHQLHQGGTSASTKAPTLDGANSSEEVLPTTVLPTLLTTAGGSSSSTRKPSDAGGESSPARALAKAAILAEDAAAERERRPSQLLNKPFIKVKRPSQLVNKPFLVPDDRGGNVVPRNRIGGECRVDHERSSSREIGEGMARVLRPKAATDEGIVRGTGRKRGCSLC